MCAWDAGLGRDLADAGHARPHLWAGHEAWPEGEAVPPWLCHAYNPAVVPSGLLLCPAAAASAAAAAAAAAACALLMPVCC